MTFKTMILPLALGILLPVSATAGTTITDSLNPASVPASTSVQLNNMMTDLELTQPRMNKKASLGNMIRHIVFKGDLVTRVNLRINMDALIVLPEGEIALKTTIGDNRGFKVSGVNSNKILVTPLSVGLDSSLLVFGTSGQIYAFYLRSYGVKSWKLNHAVTYMENPPVLRGVSETVVGGAEEDAGVDAAIESEAISKADAEIETPDYLIKKEGVTASDLTFGFDVATEYLSLKPVAIYSDGAFTYFKYGPDLQSLHDLPVIYKVVDGLDHPINSRVEGGTIVMEGIGDKWTIRAGDKHACVRKGGV